MRLTDILITIAAGILIGLGITVLDFGPVVYVPAQVGVMLYVLNRLDVRRLRKEYQEARAAYDELTGPMPMGGIEVPPPNEFFPDDPPSDPEDFKDA